MCECDLTNKTEPPPTRDVNRDSGTDRANGGWLRRLVRPRLRHTTQNNGKRRTHLRRSPAMPCFTARPHLFGLSGGWSPSWMSNSPACGDPAVQWVFGRWGQYCLHGTTPPHSKSVLAQPLSLGTAHRYRGSYRRTPKLVCKLSWRSSGLTIKAQARGINQHEPRSGPGPAIPRCLQRIVRHHFTGAGSSKYSFPYFSPTFKMIIP